MLPFTPLCSVTPPACSRPLYPHPHLRLGVHDVSAAKDASQEPLVLQHARTQISFPRCLRDHVHGLHPSDWTLLPRRLEGHDDLVDHLPDGLCLAPGRRLRLNGLCGLLPNLPTLYATPTGTGP